MTYRLYGVPDFANLAVHLALEETAAPYEAIFLDAEAGALKAPDHMARHPLGMVPALERGVRVVMAHCASLGQARDIDRPSAPRIAAFEHAAHGQSVGEDLGIQALGGKPFSHIYVLPLSAPQAGSLNAADVLARVAVEPAKEG